MSTTVNDAQKLSRLVGTNLQTHRITANLETTEKFGTIARKFINVITLGIYGCYLKSQMLSVAKKIDDIFKKKEELIKEGTVKETDFSKIAALSIKFVAKLKGSRHHKADQILKKTLNLDQAKNVTSIPVTEKESKKVLEACYQFASKLREKLAKNNPHDNLCFSTPSILLALSMTLKGLTEGDKQAFTETIGLKEMKEERIHAAVGELTSLLSVNSPHAKCTLSNAVLTTKGFTPQFIQTITQQYKGEVFFEETGENIAKKANAFVKEKTDGMIEKIVTPSDQIESIVVNALYFKGEWIKEFDKKKTAFVEFTSSNGTKTDVAMLHSSEDLAYSETDKCQMIEKKYKSPEGKNLSFLALLPKGDNNVEDIEKELTMQMVQDCRKNATTQKVNVIFPKFDIETSYPDLKETLESMGLSFLGGLEKTPITQLVHKTRVKLDEKGTEAAAATAVVTKSVASEPIEFKANKPFTYLIILNNQVLFQGSIRNQKGLEIKPE